LRITATVQARVGSTRLPAKVMKLICDKPMLQLHLERIKCSRLIDEIIVATTTNPNDDVIVNLAQKVGVGVYRGSEEDVLGRLVGLLRKHKVELHVELVGDSPLIDPHLIDEVIGFYLKHKEEFDFVTNGMRLTYPNGMEVNVYPAEILFDAEKKIAIEDPLREDVDIHITHNSKYRRCNLTAPHYYHNPDLYVEVDTMNDFKVVSAIFEHFMPIHPHFSLAQIIEFLKQRPDLVKLNQKVKRRYTKFKRNYPGEVVYV